jgi:hypothetical protein
MPSRSFRFVTSLLLSLTILAGCGGSSGGKDAQIVTGPGFQFKAPADWPVTRAQGRVAAGTNEELVQVATFALLKPYSSGLFSKVQKELTQRMTTLAGQTGGRLAKTETVTAGGVRSHSYRVESKDRVDQYTFVLRGRREYQLLCRRQASTGDETCRQLLESFAFA